MLRYLGSGPRQFGLHPLKPIMRMNWEFFAVVRGRCAPLAPGGTPPPLAAQTLWVTPPGSAHTWAGEGKRRAHVAVFHFGSVPAPLEAFVRERGQVALALKPAECERIAALARDLQTDFRQPNSLSNLVFQGAVIELSLLVLRNLAKGNIPALTDHAERTVESATRWFADNVRTNPTIVEVARQVHVSPSTLRRLFRRVLHQQPARAFGRIQIEKGMRLMTETKLKLDGIAIECGFTCTSDFCRAFKAFTKVTPTVWRRTILVAPRAATQ
ncbi:MAG: AraC family transcriptional regulator [Verrucomicrobiota bacterium]